MILYSIVNVRRELKFFEDVASCYGLDIGVETGDESKGLKLYKRLFFGVGEGLEKGNISMLKALVVLWGTKKVSLSLSHWSASFSSLLCGFLQLGSKYRFGIDLFTLLMC